MFTFKLGRAAYVSGAPVVADDLAKTLVYVPDQVAEDPSAYVDAGFHVRTFLDEDIPAQLAIEDAPLLDGGLLADIVVRCQLPDSL